MNIECFMCPFLIRLIEGFPINSLGINKNNNWNGLKHGLTQKCILILKKGNKISLLSFRRCRRKNSLSFKLVNTGKCSSIYLAFHIYLYCRINRRVQKGKLLFIEVLQLVNGEPMLELSYHHFVILYEIMDPHNDYLRLLATQKEK